MTAPAADLRGRFVGRQKKTSTADNAAGTVPSLIAKRSEYQIRMHSKRVPMMVTRSS
jgi:hypothetical protein